MGRSRPMESSSLIQYGSPRSQPLTAAEDLGQKSQAGNKLWKQMMRPPTPFTCDFLFSECLWLLKRQKQKRPHDRKEKKLRTIFSKGRASQGYSRILNTIFRVFVKKKCHISCDFFSPLKFLSESCHCYPGKFFIKALRKKIKSAG